MKHAVIFHNSQCGTARTVLATLKAACDDVEIVSYLETGWTRELLLALFTGAGLTAAEALRRDRSPAAELGLLGPDISDDALIDAMLEHPVLVNRPFVVTAKGTRLCRPAERVDQIL